MAYEAMNNAGSLESRLIVVLNDNDMSIAPPVGAMSAYLSRLISSQSYRNLRHVAAQVARKFPRPMAQMLKRAEEYARGLVTGGTLFEELGFLTMSGPIDGHNIDHLLPVLRNVRDARARRARFSSTPSPRRATGYAPAVNAADKFHGVSRFDVVTGAPGGEEEASGADLHVGVSARALIAEARRDEKIVGITAAMPAGTGIDKFAAAFPDRAFDVGLAEQHAR